MISVVQQMREKPICSSLFRKNLNMIEVSLDKDFRFWKVYRDNETNYSVSQYL